MLIMDLILEWDSSHEGPGSGQICGQAEENSGGG